MSFSFPGETILTTREVLRWWEFRRPIFNLVLLVVGISSIAAMEWFINPLAEGQDAVQPIELILIVVAYGLLVNLCYTLGWVVELWERKTDRIAARQRGKLIFRVMLAFSSILSSGPLWFGCAYWLMNRFRSR